MLVLEAELLFEFADFRFDERRCPFGLDESVATLAGLSLDSVEAESQFFDAIVMAEGVALARSDGEDADGLAFCLTATLDALDVLDVVHVGCWLVVGWLLVGKVCPRRGWHLPHEADSHAEGYEDSRVDDDGDDPEGADLVLIHFWLLVGCWCLLGRDW